MSTNRDEWPCRFEADEWEGILHRTGYKHPAKFRRSVIEDILRHAMIDNDWLRPGDVVLDPFAGVGCGGVACARAHVGWIGVEVEPKLVDIAKRNFTFNRERWLAGNRPLPLIFAGDSRRLAVAKESIACVIAAPPSLDLIKDSGSNEGSGAHGDKPRRGRKNATSFQGFGLSGGQLADMAVTPPVPSPPAAGQISGLRTGDVGAVLAPGSADDETFWNACRDVLQRCHGVLKPGGIAIWNTADLVRDKQRVCFGDDWLRLCQLCDFELLCRHRASRVLVRREPGLCGTIETRKQRKSFFRLMAERNGAPNIDEEDVICTRKI